MILVETVIRGYGTWKDVSGFVANYARVMQDERRNKIEPSKIERALVDDLDGFLEVQGIVYLARGTNPTYVKAYRGHPVLIRISTSQEREGAWPGTPDKDRQVSISGLAIAVDQALEELQLNLYSKAEAVPAPDSLRNPFP